MVVLLARVPDFLLTFETWPPDYFILWHSTLLLHCLAMCYWRWVHYSRIALKYETSPSLKVTLLLSLDMHKQHSWQSILSYIYISQSKLVYMNSTVEWVSFRMIKTVLNWPSIALIALHVFLETEYYEITWFYGYAQYTRHSWFVSVILMYIGFPFG